MSIFTPQDESSIKERGSKPEEVLVQIKNFENGFPFLKVKQAATIGEGILKTDDHSRDSFAKQYEEAVKGLEVVKFVPASGAASRMFKALFAFLSEAEKNGDGGKSILGNPEHKSVKAFFENLEKFAFAPELEELATKNGSSLAELQQHGQYDKILSLLLGEDGLDYGSLPKGLLTFHAYEGYGRTPVEEHLVEGANYAKNAEGKVVIHLTVSPEHEAKFKEKVAAVLDQYQKEFAATFEVSYSQQKPATDTIAVDLQNKPFRDEEGNLLFRPGGHGALVENLNDIDADLIFIKNIDNVVPDRLKGDTFLYKKVLGGILLHYQEKIFQYLKKIEAQAAPDPALIEEVGNFLENELCCTPPAGFDGSSPAEKLAYFTKKLNRPVRVCGMVKNEGEPGGGPFWAQNPDGSTSLQVVESAQIDMDDAGQAKIVQGATHFNPVDLICAVKDYKGDRFDLLQFRDPQTGFISKKSKDGKDLKAQELPGLWNGTMSDWNTIFVEVPIITFNPVKTVNDLLRDEHQDG